MLPSGNTDRIEMGRRSLWSSRSALRHPHGLCMVAADELGQGLVEAAAVQIDGRERELRPGIFTVGPDGAQGGALGDRHGDRGVVPAHVSGESTIARSRNCRARRLSSRVTRIGLFAREIRENGALAKTAGIRLHPRAPAHRLAGRHPAGESGKAGRAMA